MTIKKTAALLTLCAALIQAPSAFARPVVIELFTSDCCSYCPPAEAYIGELTKRSDILPLTFHVTYWDRIGWKDEYGDELFTNRQTLYQLGWKQRSNYTPQVVVDGLDDASGADKKRIEGLVNQAKQGLVDIPVKLKISAEKMTIILPERKGAPVADIWVMGFDNERESTPNRGENKGKKLMTHHVVRHMQKAGQWDGTVQEISVPKEWPLSPDRVAVILQQEGQGRVLGVAVADYN
jgi:hypothetical protein